VANNVIFNPTWAGRETLAVAENETRFVKGIRKKLANEFEEGGVKLGATVGVRLPQRFVTNKGQAYQGQGINDQIVFITITDQANIGWGWSSMSGSLDIQDAYERYVDPAGIQMANTWDKDGLSRLYKDVYQTQGTPGTVPVSNSTYYNAAVDLDNSAVPSKPRNMVINSIMGAAIGNANVTLFGPGRQRDEAFEDGVWTSDALMWPTWWKDVNVYPHTFGTTASSTPVINGANQTGGTLITSGWNSGNTTLNYGDVFTIGSGTTGCYAVNPQSYQSTTNLQRFVVTAQISDTTGAITIPISPSIITTGAYQTVVASPSNSATINLVGGSGTISPVGLGFHEEAFVMASVPPIMPNMGKAKIIKKDQIAIRIWEGSDIMSDQHPTRIDSFYGFKTLRADWAVRVQS
jgi:hypothetical protein